MRSRSDSLRVLFSNYTKDEIEQRRAGWKEGGAKRRTDIPAETVCQLYKDGVSEKALAERFSVWRASIRRCLLESGIEPRDRSEAMLLRMQQTSLEDRKKLVRAANRAAAGRTCTTAEKEKRAQTRERKQSQRDPSAMLLQTWLHSRGISSTCEKAVGIYNVDLAIGSTVAVELHGGGWHLGERHRAREPRRLKFILDAGWHAVTIWVERRKGHPLTKGSAEYLVAMLDELRRNPSLRRQNRVIWGDGQDHSSARLDVDDVADVAPPH